MAPKASVKLTVLHNGSEKVLTLTLGELPNAKEARASAEKETVAPISASSASRLLRPPGSQARAPRVWLSPGSIPSGVAADHGFSTGDVILEVAGKSVSTPTDVREVITTARTQGKRTVLVRVKKGDNTRFVALPLGRG